MRKKRLEDHVKFPATYRLRIIAILTIALLFTLPVHAQETLWKELNSKVIKSYQGDQYPEAISTGNEALKVAEKTFGPEHPDVALTLNNLAQLYSDQERYDDAESLYKRVLTILEKALGPDHQNVAYVLEEQASLCLKTGRKDEAEKLSERAEQIRSKGIK